jgi:hypothetical protein
VKTSTFSTTLRLAPAGTSGRRYFTSALPTRFRTLRRAHEVLAREHPKRVGVGARAVDAHPQRPLLTDQDDLHRLHLVGRIERDGLHEVRAGRRRVRLDRDDLRRRVVRLRHAVPCYHGSVIVVRPPRLRAQIRDSSEREFAIPDLNH